MGNIAIITARGGSKRIPKKNIKEFCGKPIIAYSIKAALDSGAFDEVMVSTDSEEIADIAREYGAAVPFLRSEATANDFATTADVLKEVIDEYKKIGKEFDNMCCIYPTAPFVTGEKLVVAMNLLSESGADTVMPVVAFSFPPQRGMVINDGKLEYKYPEFALCRSQDLEKMYHDPGQFYCVNVNKFLASGKLVMENTMPFVIDEMEVQDIDNMSDWEIAEIKYQAMLSKNQ
ncbi:MAG: pseudaminic acid cytidylyltransferase [Lachnospiraceae bacterium]|nr:pseudaminic acid cytidylyltransferase [Lachnospiraceae bacterium]